MRILFLYILFWGVLNNLSLKNNLSDRITMCLGKKCTGQVNCTACYNCNRCAYCNSGGRCGVCGLRKSNERKTNDIIYRNLNTLNPTNSISNQVNKVTPNQENFSSVDFKVIKPKSFFYTNPTDLVSRKAYLVQGDRGTALNKYDMFIYTEFKNNRGIITKGWIKIDDIEF